MLFPSRSKAGPFHCLYWALSAIPPLRSVFVSQQVPSLQFWEASEGRVLCVGFLFLICSALLVLFFALPFVYVSGKMIHQPWLALASVNSLRTR